MSCAASSFAPREPAFHRGKVLWFSIHLKYDFLRGEETHEDVFVHYRAIVVESLSPGGPKSSDTIRGLEVWRDMFSKELKHWFGGTMTDKVCLGAQSSRSIKVSDM
jgi:cold shock CspA family protein